MTEYKKEEKKRGLYAFECAESNKSSKLKSFTVHGIMGLPKEIVSYYTMLSS